MEGLTFNEETHTYKLNGVELPSVTQIITSIGLVDYSMVNKDLLDYKADIGRKIHKTIELYDNKELDNSELHPLLRNYLEQWRKFKKDFRLHTIESEIRMFHPAYKYAGTIDKLGRIDDYYVILDIKSGGISPSHSIQTSAYKEMLEKNTQIKIKKRFAVYLTEENYTVVEHKDNDLGVFLAALSIYNWKKKNKLILIT